jgi:hypothetical protein
LTGFKLFAGQALAVGDPVLFGARLAGVEIRGSEWVIRLEPDSGVLVTQFKALELADWDAGQSARSVAEAPRLDPEPARGAGR